MFTDRGNPGLDFRGHCIWESATVPWQTPVQIAPDIYRSSVSSVRWKKWLMETGRTITVTGQIHCPPCCSTSKHHAPFPIWHTNPHTHLRAYTPHALSHRAAHCFFEGKGGEGSIFFLQNWSNKITANASDWLLIFPLVYADPNCQNNI